MSEKPMLVMIPKDAKVREDANFIYIKTPRQKYESRYMKGSIVLSYPSDEGWSGHNVETVWIDEMKEPPLSECGVVALTEKGK